MMYQPSRQNEEIQLAFDLPVPDMATLTEQGSVLLDDKMRHPSRYHSVVKSNKLIKETRYFLPALQQRLLLLFISKIKPDDTEILTYRIPIREIADSLGVSMTGGSVYARIRNSLKALRDSSWFIRENGEETLFSWLDTYTYSKGIITVKLSESLRPYLLAQSRDFTQYQLLGALALKSKYSIRLYETLLSDTWKKRPITYQLDWLRETFTEPGKLMEYKNFKKLVITNSINEINRLTNISIAFEETRTAEGVKYITFHVKEKSSLERLAADINAFKTLTETASPAEKEETAVRQIIEKLPESELRLLKAISASAKGQQPKSDPVSGCANIECSVDDLLTVSDNYKGLLKTLDELCNKSWTVLGPRKKNLLKWIHEYQINGATIDILVDEKMLLYL